ncbi:hypothetical protein [Sphingomonas sp.]|uniref:hypothetical protein n=1 Tax=Sphingomonas sp. TaxID=28214 RepID=UPI003B3B16EC
MTARFYRCLGLVALGAAAVGFTAPAQAYLFWSRPALGGTPAVGGETGITLPMPGAQPKELEANLVWTLRAGLNVAALQCQFAPTLRTVENYNNMLRQHSAELQATYATLTAYFKRTGGKSWQTALDQYTTRTYNSFSTLQAQLIFCETAASIGEQTLDETRGHLADVAVSRMRELRNSLIPAGDRGLATQNASLALAPIADPRCYNKRGKEIRCKN